MSEGRRPRGALAALVAAAAVALAGCQAAPTSGPSGGPTGPTVLGLDWGRAPSVERPSNYETTVPPSDPGVHPILRIQGQANMTDVIETAAGGYAAIGYAPPDWVPVAWTSPDAQRWSFHAMDPTPFTFPIALAHGANGSLVAVGRAGGRAAAWRSTDGATWESMDVPQLGTGVAERMTTIAAGAPGLVAGGSVGAELFERHARFWIAPDGARWQPVPDDASAFGDAEVRSITSFGDGFVAVGVAGDAQHPTGAVAWTSPDGERWTRVDDPEFVGGVAVSVVVAPSGGLVAVGSDLGRRNAVAWTSADGVAWNRAPDEPSRQHSGGYAWLTDVAAIDGKLIAVGVIQGLQRGTVMSWVSTDGLTWQRSNRAPVQEGAEVYAIVAGGPGAIAIGAFGAPDSYVPIVFLSPAR